MTYGLTPATERLLSHQALGKSRVALNAGVVEKTSEMKAMNTIARFGRSLFATLTIWTGTSGAAYSVRAEIVVDGGRMLNR